MGRRKQIKVICTKSFSGWLSSAHLIKSGIVPETKEGTQDFLKFEKGKAYNCSKEIECLSGSKIVYVDTTVLHSIGGPEYPKHLYELFYIKQGEIKDMRRNFKDYFTYIKK